MADSSPISAYSVISSETRGFGLVSPAATTALGARNGERGRERQHAHAHHRRRAVEPGRHRIERSERTMESCARAGVWYRWTANVCTILIAEDHPDTREAMTLELEGQGHSVYPVADGIEALNWL